jgi:hypothetical protein
MKIYIDGTPHSLVEAMRWEDYDMLHKHFIAVGACVEYKTLVAGASSNHIAVSHASGYRYNDNRSEQSAAT